MPDKLTTLGVKEVCQYRWQVTYDGRITGDDYGYNTEAQCWAEVDNRLAIDKRDAVRYSRPILYAKGE